MGVRSKKHQYVSLNAATNLVNSSLEIPPHQASTIVQSSNKEAIIQKISASKVNMRHNWQQLENVRDNLNRTTLVKSVGKAPGQNTGTYKLRADSMNISKLAPSLNEALESAHLNTNKHRQSYKQTQHLHL